MVAARLLVAFALLLAVPPVFAQSPPGGPGSRLAPEAEMDSDLQYAAVELDGRVLFRVAGVASTFPAKARAERIAARIAALGDAPTFQPDALKVDVAGNDRPIVYEGRMVAVVTEFDSRLLNGSPADTARLYRDRIEEAVLQYRAERGPEFLRTAVLKLGGAVVVGILAAALIVAVVRFVDRFIDRRLQHRIHDVGIQSFEILRAERIWSLVRGALALARLLALAGVALAVLQYALLLFPWTRSFALGMLDLVVTPLKEIGAGITRTLPNLAFLLVLALITRYLLRMVRLFFREVRVGRVKLQDFDPEWADPTYKLVRLAIVAFALVVAYPYIPGSGSEAFKGVSLFLGIIFSLGSTTVIANMVAGYALTYRRAFKVGDRIKVGDTMGDVIDVRLQVTHLRTPKNEEVIVPNSHLLNNAIVNLSAIARGEGLFLNVQAGIGYETPWRQVEAMLLLAARRTEGILADPAPFVVHEGLGDFAVNYVLFAAIREAREMLPLQTALSRNVLDVFNEYGVQIMTPNYMADTAEAKVVKPADWYLPPAASPAVAPAR